VHPDLSDKIALVTGANRGLGAAIARALSAAGAGVALVARDAEKLQSVQRQIESDGGRALVFVADVTDEHAVLQLEQDVRRQLGPVQILVNNAGTILRKDIADITLEEFRGVMDSSVIGTFLMCRSFVPHMKGSGYGRIVNMSSTMGKVSLPGRTAYSSAKFAILGFTKALALELAADQITVNAICPGPFETDLLKPILENPQARTQILEAIPLGRWGKPEEIGALVCYLCSELAGFITGTDVLIDGAWTAR
jgi:NAD(P)-dependent dehydrogenase (short-subunit alcohol dehydrogenase family)